MLKITRNVYNAAVAHARREAPLEACGYFAGTDGVVTEIYPLTNTDKSGEHYAMDPAEQFRVFKDMRNLGMELVGIYHSHAYAPAYPSARDRELAFYAEAGYLIVSLIDPEKPEIRSFKIPEGKVEEEKILVVPDGDC